ncbi:polynucleotide 5'-phosphatase SKDI_13G3100 [Saccharomyces kudriavzevii IFO 1802]|uniref:mRNA-capping enzyme subunit beta n=2 Tax=Saccharomyces kudriavzevii (strain ATCC MYA-4449 / AS 2.2408 / CBS 8840 / NBRC 1802 / NCYC 2889) TaxID=226230 RepID=J5PAY3_SACK1|nr:uncharacterized protein SKDI_13G3100 [Saccharomyces kudriavzevii IFO 1802]EJT41843.1 CTL1-like protein [Saccharomyces kudriavzevii IFO 1802]CAI4048575.1 hypothetical protein SKDI_13G3100 [Saccharomyces kudriavzevii IFO 1802]
MPDQPEIHSNKSGSHDDASTKVADSDVVRKLGSLHISKTTRPVKSARLPKNSGAVKKFHKHVCKLVWTHLTRIRKDSIPHIEIEIKFGMITDKKTHRRIAHRSKPSIVQGSNGRLVSNVSGKTFSRFQELLCSKPVNTKIGSLSAVRRAQTYTKDTIYNVKNVPKADRLASWRCSEDLKSKESKSTYIKKIRVKDLLLHYPQSSLDAKVSISIEVPQYEISAFLGNDSVLQRFKERSTYCFDDKMIPLHLDLTKVTTKRNGLSHQFTTREVEVEMNPIFKDTIFANDEEKFDDYMNLFLHTSNLICKAAEPEKQ